MDWGKALDAIKLSPKYLLPIALATGFLLFGSSQQISKLGLDSFASLYRPWIGLVFLLSIVLLTTQLLLNAGLWLKHKYEQNQAMAIAQKRLANLTPEEKYILGGYIVRQTRTQDLDFTNGVVTGLEHAHIIYRAANVGSLVDGFAYNIQPWAWKYLNKRKELLDISEEEKQKIINSSLFTDIIRYRW